MTPPTWLYWPAPTAAWVPSDLTNLVGWWDADAITGLSDTDPVSTWEDLSASGWDGTAGISNRPTYRTGVLNGKPIVRFSGSNHLSLGGINLFRNVGGGTIYAVQKTATTPTGPEFSFAGFTGASGVRASIDAGGTLSGGTRRWRMVARREDADSATVASSTAVVTTNWVLHGGIFDWSGGAVTQYIDAVADGTGSPSSGTTSDSAAKAAVIGAVNTNNSNGFNGDIAEIVVVHEALGTSDRQRLEGYLAWKWGLEANLPVEHPYKDEAP